MISVGEKIDTGFEVDVVHAGEQMRSKFGDLLTRPTVVSVYMKNNTSGCDRQNESLVGGAAELDALGFNLVALSKDTCGSHLRYAQKLGIDYILVSDPENLFAQATDSMVQKRMYGRSYTAPSRSAFALDTDGTVLGLIEKVNTKSHSEEVADLVRGLQA